MKRKNASLESKYFPFRGNTFSAGNWCTGKQAGSHKNCLHCKKMADNLSGVYTILSACMEAVKRLLVLRHMSKYEKTFYGLHTRT